MFQKLKISSAKKYIENSIYDHRPKAVRQIDKLGVILDEKVLNKIAYDQLKKAFSSGRGLTNKVLQLEHS
jgi:hypothetical protein